MTVEDLLWFTGYIDLEGKCFWLYYDKEDYIYINYTDGIIEYLIYIQDKPVKSGVF